MTTTTTGPGMHGTSRAAAALPRALAVALVAAIAHQLAVASGHGDFAGLAAALAAAGLAFAGALARPRTAAPPMVPASVIAEQRREDRTKVLALELAVDRLRSVLEALREGVVVVDGGGEVVLANPEARHALRDPAEPPIGKLLDDVLAPELGPSFRTAFASLDDETLGRDRPVRLSSIAFGKRMLDLTAVRVRSRESGQDFGTVFLLVDATRSHELAQLKDRFLSGISHELRTPLTNVCAYAEILRKLSPHESAEWPEFVQIVHEESLQLSRLVDTVFDYAQLESGEAVFHLVTCDVAPLIREGNQRIAEAAAVRGITVLCEIEQPLPPVRVDPARFLRVVGNLLDNAIKFTPHEGVVQLTVTVERGHVRLCVDDSGPGIASSDRDAVFEKFHQLGDHLTSKVAGAGLGLATTKVIVERMGGRIRCEEAAIGGARFVVELPVVTATPGPGPVATSPAAAGSGEDPLDPARQRG